MKLAHETYKLGSGLLMHIMTYKGTPFRQYKIVDTTDNSIVWTLSAEVTGSLEEFRTETP